MIRLEIEVHTIYTNKKEKDMAARPIGLLYIIIGLLCEPFYADVPTNLKIQALTSSDIC